MKIAGIGLTVLFASAVLIGFLFLISYVCVTFYNAVILAVTKDESKQVRTVSVSAILTFIMFCYIVYRIVNLGDTTEF